MFRPRQVQNYLGKLTTLRINKEIIYFRNIYKMKKSKQDQPNPITLSSKRHSLQQEKLTPVQKMDWNAPLQKADNNHHKSFFTNMKAELSNIRNDFEKLVQREDKGGIGLAVKEKEIIEQKNGWGTNEKAKSYSSYKAEEKYFTDKKVDASTEQNSKVKDTPESASKSFNLTKNINEAVNFKNKHISNRDVDPHSNNPISKYVAQEPKEVDANPSSYDSVNSKKYSTTFNEASNDKMTILHKMESQRQKEMTMKLQQQNATYKSQNHRLKTDVSKLTDQNAQLSSKIVKLTANLNEKGQKYKHNQDNISKYQELLQKFNQNEQKSTQRQRQILQLQQSINKQREQNEKQLIYYQHKIDQLSFYNHSFYTDNQRLSEENLRLTEVINNMQKLIEDSRRMQNQNDAENQRKTQYLQKTIKEYEKREKMLGKEIERLCQQLNSQETISTQQKLHQNHQLQKDSKDVSVQIQFLKTQLDKQKEINALLLKKYKEQIQKLNIQSIAKSLQQSIQSLTDQNGQLKSQCNTLTSKIKELEERNRAYCRQIMLYQQREKAVGKSRNLSCNQWQEMTEKIQALEVENKKLKELSDYKQLLQEVLTQKDEFDVAFEIKEDHENLIKASKGQLDEISKLRFEIQKIQIRLNLCQEDRQQLKLHKIRLQQEIKAFISFQRSAEESYLLKNYEEMRLQIEQKQTNIRHLKQFIRKSLKLSEDTT